MKGCLLAPLRIIVALPVLLIEGAKWCLKNGMKGFIAFGVFMLIIAVILGKTCGGSAPDKADIPTGGDNMPTKIEAPYYVTTGSEQYFVEKYHWQGSLLLIQNYWELKGGDWVNSGDKARALSNKPKVVKR